MKYNLINYKIKDIKLYLENSCYFPLEGYYIIFSKLINMKISK